MPTEPPIILAPNQKWPDVAAMNDRCPKPDWRMYYDKLVGPYQKQKLLYLWDSSIAMNKYTWPASADSGMAAISDLVEKIEMMRQFKRVKAIPIVKLSSRLWSRRYGTPGPDFIIVRWVVKSASGGLLLPTTEPIALAAPAPATDNVFADIQTVEPPTGKEVTGDEIPF